MRLSTGRPGIPSGQFLIPFTWMKVIEMNIRNEKGFTLLGFLILLATVLFFAYAGMRVVPMYLEYHALGNALSKLENDPAAKKMTPQKIKQSIKSSLWASYASNNIDVQHIHISKKSGGVSVRVAYEVREPFMGHIDLIGSFDKSVVLK
jgi:hypothetical protein